jgi:hypothetical protein
LLLAVYAVALFPSFVYEEIIEEEYEKDESGNGKDSKERTGRVRLKP